MLSKILAIALTARRIKLGGLCTQDLGHSNVTVAARNESHSLQHSVQAGQQVVSIEAIQLRKQCAPAQTLCW